MPHNPTPKLTLAYPIETHGLNAIRSNQTTPFMALINAPPSPITRVQTYHLPFAEDPEGLILYAPSFLGVWALEQAAKGGRIFSTSQRENTNFAGLILESKILCSKFMRNIYLLRLKNERRRLGSDVPSPLITCHLRRHVSVADHFFLPIGAWINLLIRFSANLESLQQKKIPLLWLNQAKDAASIQDFFAHF